MKNFLLKTWLTMLCLLIGVGTSWGAKITKTINEVVSENNYTVSSGSTINTKCTSINLDENINISVSVKDGATGNTGTFWGTTTLDWRLYQGDEPTITVAAQTGYTITSVKFTYTNANSSAINTKGHGTVGQANVLDSGTAYDVNGASVVYYVGNTSTKTNGQARITAIEVNYTSAGSSTPTSYSVTIANDISNGNVSASSTSAIEGSEITLTATPDDGYEFGSWNVTNASTSEKINVESNKFTMPAANVNVSATFNKIAGGETSNTKTGTITFGTNNVKIDNASVTGKDNLGNTWTITTVGTTSFTANASYYQVGSSNNPATSITFTTTFPENVSISSMSAKFGGFSSTAGTVNLKVGDTTIGTGNLNATNDVTISSTSTGIGKVLTVTLTGIAKGVKVYNISYTYTSAGETPEPPTLQSIAVSGTPTKTTYMDGDAFDTTGLVVTGTYSNASTETITEGITWNVTPETLTAGTTYVFVTATVNNVASAAYTVDGLTVKAITEKSIADFIASEGGKCYLIGTVSDIKNDKYGNYTLTDGSGSIYVYGTLSPNGEAQQFASLGIEEGDKIKVLANEYELYNGTKEAKNVVFVEKIESAPSVTKYNITIADDIANGTVTANTNEAEKDATITLTATPATGYEFTSWNVTDASDNAITVTNDQFTMPASDVTVSATFTEVQQGGDEPVGEYVLTDVNKIGEEDEVVIVFTNSTASYAMSNENGTSNPPSAVEVTVANNSVSSPADNILWNVAYSDGTFVIYPKGETKKWLYCTNTNNGVRVGTGDAKHFQINDGYLYETETTDARYLGVYNNADVRCYTSINSNIAEQTLAFYVKKAAPKVLASISLSGEYQTEFIQNQEFNHTGVVVTANYEDESTKDVTAKATFSEPDMTTVGTKTITVSYTEGEVTKTETYNITVAAEELTSIELGGTYPTNFEQNGTFNHDGLTVTAHYNSGRTADVTNDANFSTPNMSNLGEQTITVSYGGQEATYTIKVAGYYTVTIDNTHDTNGTISVWNGDVELESGAQVLDGTKLTIKCTPTDGYKYKNWQYKAKGDWTTKYTNFEYTIDDSNVSFRANFEKIPEYTITYYVNGVPTTETLREGEPVKEIPTVDTKVGDKVFVGWATTVTVPTTNPTFVDPATIEHKDNANYFAVFANEVTTEEETGDEEWVKVPHDFTGWTNAENLANQYLIVSEYIEKGQRKAYIFNGTGNRNDYLTADINENKIDHNNSYAYITMRTINTSHIGFVLHSENSNNGYLVGVQGGNGINFYDFSDENQLSGITVSYANHSIGLNDYENYIDKTKGQWSVTGYHSEAKRYTYLRFNTAEGYFRFYQTETTGQPVEFYVKKAATETTTTYSDFTTNMGKEERTDKVADGKYFTICLPYKFHKDAIIGATPYNIVGRDGSSIELDEEKGNLVAGRPYFMVGNSNAFTGYYSLDNEVKTAGTNNGLIGTFKQFAFNVHPDIFENGAEIYVVLDTNIKKAYSTGGGVNAYRAYIDLNQIEDKTTSSVSRIAIDVEGGTTTAIESVEDIEKDNTIYNLQGQRINRADKGVYIVNGRKVIR